MKQLFKNIQGSQRMILIVVVLVALALILAGGVGLTQIYRSEASISVSKETIPLTAGNTADMGVEVSGQGRTPTITYTSSNNSIATVSEDGTISARREGECTVTAETVEGQKVSVDLTIVQPDMDKTIYLTFDDGPSPDVTTELLSVLAKYDAKATFFLVGKEAEVNSDIVEQEASAGHTIAIHAYDDDLGVIYKDAETYLA